MATMPGKNVASPMANGNELARREAIRSTFVQLVNQVPDAPAGTIEDLLGPILAAATWEDLIDQDSLPSSKTLAGRELKLDAMAKKVSDKDSITGYYLFCEGVDLSTGEPIRWTAGGEQAVAVMSRLYVLGAIPAKIKYTSVGTDSGNDAINCTVLDVYTDTRTVQG